ncbi:mas-related G-protein coupled receptor member H-like [Eublepharis macularius]|uniref:Mas-related G-protein coupled receptor member H-like n=1 Tax=Eublepharis macularius TaxID=481883 RepID=A0AA97L6X8_EUBMA|nr:mas-related G-protein coupled receptor member H-like [Eublepharis macularius]
MLNLTNQTLIVDEPDDFMLNFTKWRQDFYEHLEQKIISILIISIGIFGFLGNGIVIWLLGFQTKRNSFTIYILNLAVADIGVLISMGIFFVIDKSPLFEELIIFTYSTGQFLLTVISIDRCACVLFPIWHQVHRPSYLSVMVCTLIWVFSCLLSGVHFTLHSSKILENHHHVIHYQFFVNALLGLPLMIISAVTLFIRVCLKPQQRWRGKLLTAILLTLLFFLLFGFPLNVVFITSNFSQAPLSSGMRYSLLCASLNSSVNPLIYFLVGRWNSGQPRESLKEVLKKIFEEDEASREVSEGPCQIQLSDFH